MQGDAAARVLIVDDDKALLKDVSDFLRKHGYDVDTARDGGAAVTRAGANEPDLVILDITLAESPFTDHKSIDGIEVLRRLRMLGKMPILMLSATSVPSVKVMALHIGADDYLTKPFDLEELGARVEAILRRTRTERGGVSVLTFPRLTLNPGERRVTKDGATIELTGLEFDILYSMARRPQHVFSRERLLEIAWKEPSYSIPKVIDVHIGHIRQKIEDDAASPAFVVTVRGTGYKFDDSHA